MVRQLAAAGASVRGAIHYPDHDAEARVGRVDFVEVDFDRPETLDTAFKGIDQAVLITPEETTMVAQTRTPGAGGGDAPGSVHLVRISFLHAGAAGGTLLDWHLEAERSRPGLEIPSTILRPNSYMQNFLTMYGPSIFVRGAFFTPMGGGRISYIDARDVADAAVRGPAARGPRRGREQRFRRGERPRLLAHRLKAAAARRDRRDPARASSASRSATSM